MKRHAGAAATSAVTATSPRNHPGGEAAIAFALACAILDAAEGCMGVLYDGAVRGVHCDVIACRGRLLINKQRVGGLRRIRRSENRSSRLTRGALGGSSTVASRRA